ncbi:MAG TPA: GYDIA family GHMP kinase [Saprospiraceae bacterium]|nr:GYDIA family GHMP kinase [Saprospiraceae bacterium]
MKSTHAKGKLLLTGEYFVLDGAWALALPVRFGQSLRVKTHASPGSLHWQSRNPDESVWFEARFQWPDLSVLSSTDEATAHTLADILRACSRQVPDFFAAYPSLDIVTQNDFPREWGLGTSSTLIAALGQWTGANPYQVLFETMGGSGYDIACAYAEGPLLYRLHQGTPQVQAVQLAGPVEQLFFVYLGKKQNSREGIARYRERVQQQPDLVEKVSALSLHFLETTSLEAWNELIREHEKLVSQTLDLPRAKDLYFPDFPGEIKSLGAWGGDFVLATSQESDADTKAWFKERGFPVCFNWASLV